MKFFAFRQAAKFSSSTSSTNIFHIDSYRHIRSLQETELSRHQAESIVEVVKEILRSKVALLSASLVRRDQLLRDISSLKALQRSIQVNLIKEFSMNALEQKSTRSNLAVHVAQLNDACRDLLAEMKIDALSAASNYRESNRERLQALELELHKINGILTVANGNFKAHSENTKLKAISLFSVVMIGFFATNLIERVVFTP